VSYLKAARLTTMSPGVTLRLASPVADQQSRHIRSL